MGLPEAGSGSSWALSWDEKKIRVWIPFWRSQAESKEPVCLGQNERYWAFPAISCSSIHLPITFQGSKKGKDTTVPLRSDRLDMRYTNPKVKWHAICCLLTCTLLWQHFFLIASSCPIKLIVLISSECLVCFYFGRQNIVKCVGVPGQKIHISTAGNMHWGFCFMGSNWNQLVSCFVMGWGCA